MTAMRLQRITAVGDNEYELVFEGPDSATVRMNAVVFEHRGIQAMEVEPDLLMTGRFGDARTITAAVWACHRARLEAAAWETPGSTDVMA
jgi:hypothetical protein